MKIALMIFLHKNKITLQKFAEVLEISKTRASKKLCGVEPITMNEIEILQTKIPNLAVYGNKLFLDGYFDLKAKIYINQEENKEYFEESEGQA